MLFNLIQLLRFFLRKLWFFMTKSCCFDQLIAWFKDTIIRSRECFFVFVKFIRRISNKWSYFNLLNKISSSASCISVRVSFSWLKFFPTRKIRRFLFEIIGLWRRRTMTWFDILMSNLFKRSLILSFRSQLSIIKIS